MGARLKENPKRTFNWFFEASCPIAKDKDPGLLFQFPEDYSDEECVRTLPRFCFPYDIERVKPSVTVQHFTFVLTDLEGCQRFGFCRQTSGSRACLCILSYLPWFEVFYKLLNNLADYLTKGQTNEMRDLLSALHKHPVPQLDSFATLQLGEQLQVTTGVENPLKSFHPAPVGQGESGIPFFIAPDPMSLPSIPESRNLTELVVAVDVSNLLQIYASMLFERRILIFSSKLSTLTACVHACSSMLFPMYWQHIFISVLPPHLLDYCCAPMPYLIGVHSSLSERVRSYTLEDVVILNVDTNTIESPFDDLKKIPSHVVSALKMRLKKQSAATGTGVAKAFLRAQAELFGGYKEALVCTVEGEPISFCEESFLNHKSKSMRQFLESAVHLQFFKQFIDARLELLNNGKEPADLFEEEILQAGASTSGTKSYQQWVGNLKVGGGALIHTVKSKANMYRGAKSCLRNITSKEDSHAATLYRVGSLRPPRSHQHRSVQSDCLQSRLPITQHFGKSRPRRPARRYTGPLVDESQLEQGSTWTCTWEPTLENGAAQCQEGGADSTLLEDLDTQLIQDPEEMDLLGEIFDTLSVRNSHERGFIYSTRSLDLFGSDSTEFIIQKKMVAPSQESLNNSTGRSESLLSWGQEGDVEEEQQRGTEEELSDNLGGLKEDQEQNENIEVDVERSLEERQQKDKNYDSSKSQVECDRRSNQDEDIREEKVKEEVSSQEQETMPGISELASPGMAWETGTCANSHEEVGESVVSPSETKPCNKEDSHKPLHQAEKPQVAAKTSCITSKMRVEEPVHVANEKGETAVDCPLPRVQETVALFQVKAMKKQAGVWKSPSESSNGRMESQVPVNTAIQQAGLFVETDTAGETVDAPSIKVSELKKRFEA